MTRPTSSFDHGLQHERTALAWERTAISTMVAGLVISRFAAVESFWPVAIGGLMLVVFGGALLVWAGAHYDDLHGALRAGTSVVHPGIAKLVGAVTLIGTGTSLVLAIAVALRD